MDGYVVRRGGAPGEGFRLDIKGDGEAVAVGEIVSVDPPNRIVYTWGWDGMAEVPPGSTTVTFDLDAVDGGTQVVLTHADLPLGPDDEHRQGWTHYLDRLAIVGVGGDAGPDPMGAS